MTTPISALDSNSHLPVSVTPKKRGRQKSCLYTLNGRVCDLTPTKSKENSRASSPHSHKTFEKKFSSLEEDYSALKTQLRSSRRFSGIPLSPDAASSSLAGAKINQRSVSLSWEHSCLTKITPTRPSSAPSQIQESKKNLEKEEKANNAPSSPKIQRSAGLGVQLFDSNVSDSAAHASEPVSNGLSSPLEQATPFTLLTIVPGNPEPSIQYASEEESPASISESLVDSPSMEEIGLSTEASGIKIEKSSLDETSLPDSEPGKDLRSRFLKAVEIFLYPFSYMKMMFKNAFNKLQSYFVKK